MVEKFGDSLQRSSPREPVKMYWNPNKMRLFQIMWYNLIVTCARIVQSQGIVLKRIHRHEIICYTMTAWKHVRLARWRKWRVSDVEEAKEGLENELWRRWTNGRIWEWALTYVKLCSFSKLSITSPTSQLILQPFRRFTHVTVHSPTLPSLCLRHSSFSNLSVASPSSQLILQPIFRFSYFTGSSLTSPGEPPMPVLKLVM